MRRRLLPFYDERKSKIDMIVLHSVAFEPEEAIRAFIDAKVSSHYVIGSDGEVWQLVGQNIGHGMPVNPGGGEQTI